MLAQVWVSLRDTFDFPPEQDENGLPADTELQAKNRETLSRATDIDVVPNLFKKEMQGPRSYTVYILTYEYDLIREVEQAVERLSSENPGEVKVLGGWNVDDGSMIGTENVYSTRIVTKTWSILNPDYDPNEFLEDGVTPNPDFDDRYVLRITGDVEEEYVSGYTGVPLYPLYGQLLRYMPDVGDPPVAATELTDVNLLAGQAKRYFG